MSRSTNVVQECAKLVSESSSLIPDLIGPLSSPESKPSARKYDRLFSALDTKHVGYPLPIESLLERFGDSHEPMLWAFQEMIGKGYDYNTAAAKMIETALFIIAINRRLRE
jgi:hypothetical protein